METGTVAVQDVRDASAVAEARRLAATLAARLGFSDQEAGRLAIIVTELGTNLLKHAGGGELILNRLEAPGRRAGVSVISLDKGPGMAEIGESMRDGHSTAGSAGNGLGAVRRLASDFDVYTRPGAGAAVLATVWPGSAGARAPAAAIETGSVSVPKPGEWANGDACAFSQEGGGMRCLMADGLGHGEEAARAAQAALAVFTEHPGLGLAETLETVHRALRPTRGAAVAMASVDPVRQEVRFAGVGNIAGVVVSEGVDRNMVSHNGTMGHQLHRIQEFVYPWPAGALMILHSDGVSSRWRLDERPGLVARPAALIAGVLYRDYSRQRDDATVAVVRHARARGEA